MRWDLIATGAALITLGGTALAIAWEAAAEAIRDALADLPDPDPSDSDLLEEYERHRGDPR